MTAPYYAPHWSDPPPVVVTDAEKNEAVNRIALQLAARRREEQKSDMAESENGAARAQRQVRERR